MFLPLLLRIDALLLLMLLILNYDKSIDAADQFFAPAINADPQSADRHCFAAAAAAAAISVYY